MQPAQPAVQLVGRQSYRGGWPLGYTTATCPAEAPIGCKSNPAYNLNCCPSGQFCFGTLQPYCCPTDDDCGAAVRNVPVCANSTWNMYRIEQVANRDFFCCPNGYVGVLPSSGAAGICDGSGADLPMSRLATMASQIGGTAVTSFGGIATASLSGVAPHTSTGTGRLPATTGGEPAATGGRSATSGGGGAPTGSASAGDGPGAVSSTGLPIGAIVGIAIGAVAVLVLGIALVLWLHRRSLRRRPPQATVPPPASETAPEEYLKGTQMQQTAAVGPTHPAPGYWPAHAIAEAPAVSRAEL